MSKENSFRFGMAQIDGRRYWIRDLIILPDGTVKRRNIQNWLIHHHEFQGDEIDELISSGVKVLVVGKGSLSRANICDAVAERIANNGVELVLLSSKDALAELKKYSTPEKNVGAIIHILC